MSPSAIQRVLGLLLMVFSLTMLPPAGIALTFSNANWHAFAAAFAITAACGVLIWLPVRNVRRELRLRDGFLVVALFWIVLGLFGAVPFMIAEQPEMSATDAVFESMSGLTTTGATVLVGLDWLPESILYYRQQLQWLGGMGIIVLAVAVLPMLGVGGMQLYRAETPGPVKDTKLTPRIAQTAKALWYVYLGITATCAVAYWLSGMGVFDAICHSFSTVAIGGFSTHDMSIAWFDSVLIEMVTVVFMFVCGINFSLHFLAWRRTTLSNYFLDPEFRAYVTMLGLLVLLTVAFLYATGEYSTFQQAFTKGLFQAVSIGTTTGFTTADYNGWPGSLPMVLILASFVGGCAGSTGGGMKVIRWLLIYKQGTREVSRLVHPSAEIPVKLGAQAVPYRVVDSVWGFFSVYMVLFGVMMVAVMTSGLDHVSSFASVAASMNNLGPGLGEVAYNFAGVSGPVKWVAVAAMLFGRLEIFTLLVLLTPAFWQR